MTKICKQTKISSQNNVKFRNSYQVINNEKKNNVRREVTNFKIFSPNKNSLLRTLNSRIDQNH